MREPEEEFDVEPPAALANVAAAALAVVVLVLGVFPGLITDFLREAAILRW
jgi:NADH:ubiquinone oxidoreductase subunit 2 (subunit N)